MPSFVTAVAGCTDNDIINVGIARKRKISLGRLRCNNSSEEVYDPLLWRAAENASAQIRSAQANEKVIKVALIAKPEPRRLDDNTMQSSTKLC